MTDDLGTYFIQVGAGLMLVALLSGFLVYFVLFHGRMKSQFQREMQIHEKTMLESEVEIQKQTLQDVSREIHDNIGQLAALVKLNLNMALHNHNEVDVQKVEESRRLISELISELKEISAGMGSDSISRYGICDMLQRQINRINKAGAMQVRLMVQSSRIGLDEKEELVLYRICQEILSNLIQHANATEASLILYGEDKITSVVYSDNGKGFHTEAFFRSNESKGRGLKNIRSRSRLIGFHCSIYSKPGEGTTITLTRVGNSNQFAKT